jgi:DNA-binding response OmpR family regulator
VSAEAHPRRPRVLVVDDEAPLRELIIVTLGDGFRCEEAADGETALKQLREAPPDLVFLDLMLPDRSGLDILHEMRSDPVLRHVAVVVVSAWQRPEDVKLALETGADKFLAKPFLVDELASVAKRLIERKQ